MCERSRNQVAILTDVLYVTPNDSKPSLVPDEYEWSAVDIRAVVFFRETKITDSNGMRHVQPGQFGLFPCRRMSEELTSATDRPPSSLKCLSCDFIRLLLSFLSS
jgi:hypothetical protein